MENFFLLLKFTCLKQRKILEVPTSNSKYLLEPWVGIRWAKYLRKPNHEAENFFACHGLVGELFLVLKLACPKHRELLEVPTSNMKDLLKPLVVVKWAKQPIETQS